MRHLSDTKIIHGVGKSYPFLTFTDLARRTGINRVTLTQRLKGLLERREIMKHTEYTRSMKSKHNVDRKYRTFYRVNPETSGELDRPDDGIRWYSQENAEQKRMREKESYWRISWNRSNGNIVRTRTIAPFSLQVNRASSSITIAPFSLQANQATSSIKQF